MFTVPSTLGGMMTVKNSGNQRVPIGTRGIQIKKETCLRVFVVRIKKHRHYTFIEPDVHPDVEIVARKVIVIPGKKTIYLRRGKYIVASVLTWPTDNLPSSPLKPGVFQIRDEKSGDNPVELKDLIKAKTSNNPVTQ